jgi:hypothetical protein
MRRMRGIHVVLAVASIAVMLGMLGRAGTLAATGNGDCNEDGVVSVDELVRGINAALGDGQAGSCPALDVNGDGLVQIDDLITMVGYLLTGVPQPTPTPPFAIFAIGTAGGQPCDSTVVSISVPGDSTIEIDRLRFDFCVAPTRFDVLRITCQASGSAVVQQVQVQLSCDLDAAQDPRGQVRVDAVGSGGASGTALQPFDEIDCVVPVYAQTPGGTYPVRYRLVAGTPGGDVVQMGMTEITVFGIDFVDLLNGQCCYDDTQCQSGLCQGGIGTLPLACCATPCPNGACNAPGFEGNCCAFGGLPDTCVAP